MGRPPGRLLLALGLVLALGALAGCSEMGWTLELDRVDDAGIADHYATNVSDLPPAERRVARTAAETGSATDVAREPAFSPPIPRADGSLLRRVLPLAHDGTYYELRGERAGEGAAYRLTVEVTPVDGPDAAVGDDELSERVRLALSPALRTAAGGDGNTTTVTLSARVVERSPLFGDDPTLVRVGDDTVRVTVRERSETRLPRYRYTARAVAADDAALAGTLRERSLVVFENLTAGQRALLDRAIRQDGLAPRGCPPEEFESLYGRLRAGPGVPYHDDTWLVRYDGVTYWLSAAGSCE